MQKWRLAWIIIWFVLPLGGHAQEDWNSFRDQSRTYYHIIGTPEVTNFTCQLSADYYIDFVKSFADSSFYYPLKYIWTREADHYFVLQPLPENLSDSLRRETLMRIQELKNLFNGIVVDWYKYGIRTPLDDIPNDARVQYSRDTVSVFYAYRENGQSVSVRETYSRGGQLGRVIWKTGTQKVITYPLFELVENKWLCVGWNTQRFENNTILSGVAVRMQLVKGGQHYYPTRIDIVVQTRENPNQQVLTSIYVKDFTLNEPIEVLSAPKSKNPSVPQQ